MKKTDLQQLIKEELRKVLKEEINIASELEDFLQKNPFTQENQHHHEYDVKNHIQKVMDRPLTPQEKSKITRIIRKYRDDFWGRTFREKRDREDMEEAPQTVHTIPQQTSIFGQTKMEVLIPHIVIQKVDILTIN